MIQTAATPEMTTTLDALSDAYAAGDNPLGELLFSRALDDGLPWDQVCAAAARGVAARYGGQPRG